MTATVIGIDQAGPAAILRIAGDVTSASEADLMAGLPQAIDDSGATVVVLDFSRLEYMNSGGIGLLVTLLVRAQRGGRGCVATGLSDHYRQIFALTRLDEAIEIHDDEAAAVAAATRPDLRGDRDDDAAHRRPDATAPDGQLGHAGRSPVRDRRRRRQGRRRHRQARRRAAPGLRPAVAEDLPRPARRAST